MPTPFDQLTDADRFMAKLNSLDHAPTWHEATAMGAELIDFDLEGRTLDDRITQAHADYREHYQQLESQGDIHTAEQYIESLEQRLGELADRPGRYHLASGEIIQLDPATQQAYRSGWWFDKDAQEISTPNGERFHHPGIHPEATIHPTAHVDPTARVEAGTVIGAHTRVGPHAHIGRDAMIDARCVIQKGAWIGPSSELWSNAWISPGTTIGAHSVIGTRSTIGAGSHVAQHSEIEPYSRLGTGTSTTTTKPKTNRAGQYASAIDHLMRLDRD